MICVLDVHKNTVFFLKTEDNGKEMDSDRIKADREHMQTFLKALPMGTPVIMESCYAWEYIYDMTIEMGFKAIVVDTGKLYPSGKPEKKNDLEDCRRLARLYRIGELPTVTVLDPERRNLRDLLRHRIYITRKITGFRNRVHFLVDRQGLRPKDSSLFGKKTADSKEWPIDRCSQISLASSQKILEALEIEEKAIEGELARLLLPNDDLKHLLTIPGFGLIISSVILLEMGSVDRFATKEKLVGYAGLVPKLSESDETSRNGRCRKRCNPYLKWAAVEGARQAIQNIPEIRAKYLKLMRVPEDQSTSIQKAKAVVAIARHMLEIVWCMLSRGEDFRRLQKGVPDKKMKSLKNRIKAYPSPIKARLVEQVSTTLEKDTSLIWAPTGTWEGGWEPEDDPDSNKDDLPVLLSNKRE
jgi:transposase